jgi:hypothetical protein
VLVGRHGVPQHTLGAILRGEVDVYRQETRKVTRRFLAHKLSFPDCSAALDAIHSLWKASALTDPTDTVQKLKAKGVEFVMEPKKQHYGATSILKDVDGNANRVEQK